MKKTNWYYLIDWREYTSVKSICIYYWYNLNQFNHRLRMWETIRSILWMSWYVEEDFTEEDIKEIQKHLYIFETKKYKLWTLSTSNRRQIMKLYKQEFDPWNISMKTNIDYKDVKEYLKNRENKFIIDWQKICTACDKAKTLDKFWKTKTWVRAECAECINKVRRDKYKKDPIIKKKINKQCNDSYHKHWHKRLKRSEMSDEQKEKARAADRIRWQRFRDKKKLNEIKKIRILNDKI